MVKRAFLIHGWEGHPEEGWRPWLKGELEKRGFTVIAPAMPDTGNPKLDAWLEHLKRVVGEPDKDCYLVGHSLGCITILRYLESLSEGQEIGGAVLVAGFTTNLGYDEIASFFETPIDWGKINAHCKKFVAIHSDNDPYVSIHYGREIFKQKINAEVIIEHNMKHFSGDDGINELPSVLESVLKMSGQGSSAIST
jgi:predicted alpha/beta hydrolase family esterase